MASSASLETIVQVNNNSTSRYLCQSVKFSSEEKRCENKNKSVKNNRKTSVAVKKPVMKQESTNHAQYQAHNRHAGKRRHTFSGFGEKGPPKKRHRPQTIMPPTKFLLGGNINDPLNLQSLANEEVNKMVNQVTPYSSPVPTPKHRTQVEVLIPTNINDPLNLNTGEDIEFNLISPKSKRNRKNRNRKKEKLEQKEKKEDKVDTESTVAEKETESETPVKGTTEDSKFVHIPQGKTDDRVVDKIVSPVVPQGSPTKFPRGRFYSRSISRENVDSEKHGTGKHANQRRQRYRRHTKQHPDQIKYKEKDARFQFGNYNRYYGYRNSDGFDDLRLRCMKRKWFENGDVLDIGCNVGHFTLAIAKNFGPRKIIGLDIDGSLIKMAKKNVRHYISSGLMGDVKFPMSMAICYGPLAPTSLPLEPKDLKQFPNNVFFVQGNYVLENDEMLETQKPQFDTILCLSLTKWIHLNWGDAGLKRVFRRMYAQLKPGGRMILEPQPWVSYLRKKKLTKVIYKNFLEIQMRPEQFNEYLLSKEVGFSTCEQIDSPTHPSKGFRRPMYLFTKAISSPKQEQMECQEEKSAENSSPHLSPKPESLESQEEKSLENSSHPSPKPDSFESQEEKLTENCTPQLSPNQEPLLCEEEKSSDYSSLQQTVDIKEAESGNKQT